MNPKFDWTRRSFLGLLASLTGGLFASPESNAAGLFGKKHKPIAPSVDGNPIVPIANGLGSTGDIYAELGVTPLVNISGTITVIGGSVMQPEVMELIRQGNQHFVLIDDLEIAAGKFIAKLCKFSHGLHRPRHRWRRCGHGRRLRRHDDRRPRAAHARYS